MLCPIVVGRDSELDRAWCRARRRTRRSRADRLSHRRGRDRKSRLAPRLVEMAHCEVSRSRSAAACRVESRLPVSAADRGFAALPPDRPAPSDPDLVPWLPALGAIVPSLAREMAGDCSAAVRGEAVIQLLRRLSEPEGLVVVLEDLHWADPDTLGVVEYLADNLEGARVLCLVTSRDEGPSADGPVDPAAR